mgnify:CR=1 FL=1
MFKKNELKEFLDRKVDVYDQPSFIKNDPISVPHMFTKKQDIEIAGFFASIFMSFQFSSSFFFRSCSASRRLRSNLAIHRLWISCNGTGLM